MSDNECVEDGDSSGDDHEYGADSNLLLGMNNCPDTHTLPI